MCQPLEEGENILVSANRKQMNLSCLIFPNESTLVDVVNVSVKHFPKPQYLDLKHQRLKEENKQTLIDLMKALYKTGQFAD